MNISDFRDLYDQQLRTSAEVESASSYTRLGPLWMAKYPGQGFITYRSIASEVDLEALILKALDYFSADPSIEEVEWKTRQHDDLPDLSRLLVKNGFVFDEPETVMIGTVESALSAGAGLPPGYRLEKAHNEEDLREATTQAGAVFGDSPERTERRYEELVARANAEPNSFEMWLVRGPAGDVVCTGRVDFVTGTDFAGLWGGACNEEHRGQGLYRALTAQRARSARERGKEFLQVDCTGYSRPILQRAGLVPVTVTTPAIWTR
ncbi:GNAT family N-acetyltransferase [Corynebacterium testudinoris]|uniref:Acetyltransferase (GNAT) domain n=1 Tax=Corynebacterium testudinoris TaxID=136857 RepID=A0A0G3HBI3_9CORY|nr:hypothetical protein [Corynebacterium testudinoris]AKK09308.1 Acetyltransferase (GNAT) domain [Corynebacterium testudinoris]MBX8995339.1 GNAT family N-acetyltransferase [Corynebacterium testudinoris]